MDVFFVLHACSLSQPQKLEQGIGFRRLRWQQGEHTAINV
jgi:hypothetical protein